MASSSSLIIKICGITSVDDGLVALEAGADWLGVIRWAGSKRFRPLEDVAAMLAALRLRSPRPFEAVGVYVDAEPGLIAREMALAGFDRIQLHGDEPMELIHQIQAPVIKALRVRSQEEAHSLAERYAGLDLLVDAFEEGNPGGTGRAYDYAILRDLIAERRVLVAGGLHPGNVGDMVARLSPWGVDVSSGVERAPGVKDPERVRTFIAAARAAQAV